MKYLLGLFLLFFCFSAGAQADDPLFLKGIKSFEGVGYNYHQKKFIPDIGQPFTADGVFQLVRGKGVILKQQNPEQRTFVSTLEQYCFDDKVGNLADLPHFSRIKKIVDNLLDGQDDALYQLGDVAYTEQKDGWSVDIIPTQKQLAQFIQKITLRGRDRLSFLMIEYTDGVRIEIELTPNNRDFSNEIKC